MNSHVQVPRLVLRHFAVEGKVPYLDFKTLEIRTQSAKTLGTEEDYYSENVEGELSKNVESRFGYLANRLIAEKKKGNSIFELSPEEENVCKKYISASGYRSDKTFADMLKYSLTAELETDQANRDAHIHFALRQNEGVFPHFEDFRATVLYNETDCLWVVPRNGFYAIYSQSLLCYVAPFCPTGAVALIPETLLSCNIVDTRVEAQRMNEYAVEMEYGYNCAFVAGVDKTELERLKTYVKTNRDRLEVYKKKILMA